jgi:hypothetical protein
MYAKQLTKLGLLFALAFFIAIAHADQGQMFRRNISRMPDGHTDYASIGMMHLYVPAQKADGTLEPVAYYYAAGSLIQSRDYAKPLIAGYVDEPEAELTLYPAARLPLSHSDEGPGLLGGVEFGLARDAYASVSLDDGATWKQYNLSKSAELSSFTLANGDTYPGDVHYMPYLAVEGEYVLAAWISKYCSGGTPAYNWLDESGNLLYPDLFRVAGAQVSVDYTLQGHPQVGEIPYGCVWTARGTLEEALDEGGNPTGGHQIVWRKAERLTSGRRDANLVQTAGVPGAGFVMVWQEDPEGLRPGQGLGPGEGWSGAVVHNKTDMWYSYIAWDDFAPVLEDDGDFIPKIAVPFSIPVRMTDNNICRDINSDPYCYTDFSTEPPTVYDNYGHSAGNATFCAETVLWTNPGGTTHNVCKTGDGRVLQGRTGSSRNRLSLQSYTNGSGEVSAWVIVAYEENKGLGAELDPETGEPVDIGKNVWYHSFDIFQPDLVAQGGMLNSPARDPDTGDFYDVFEDEWDNELYITDISRRFSLMAQPYTKIWGTQATAATSAIAIFKQGEVNQGGPADIMLRRFVLPDDFDPTTDNPYAYENMVCDERWYDDGRNPNYVQGLCVSPPINVSGTTAVACADGPCPPQLPDPGEVDGFPRVVEWDQTSENLDDEWWTNPFDVSKGHRGFIDGDFVMVMYAWSPNWNQNAVGNDKYNLYIRRSFDGGETWTTTPAGYIHWDNTAWTGEGTTTCENFGYGQNQYPFCTDYSAGAFEKARNVSQLTGNKITILDPRYTPTSGPKATGDILTDGGYLYPDDERNPSKYFIVYETGDNSTVVEGEARPLNLYYSRANNWGDTYYEVAYYNQNTGETYDAWDWLENQQEDLSGEAAVWANPGGTFFYAVWNQWREDEHENVSDSDIWFRRVMFVDNDEVQAAPVVSILYVSHTAVDSTTLEIEFVGSAQATGTATIVAYEWSSDLQGLLSSEKQFSISNPGRYFEFGRHTIRFRAQDSRGVWSGEATVTVDVGHRLFMPVMQKP